MTAPLRPPAYYDSIRGGDADGDPAVESCWIVDDIAGTVKTFPDWRVDETGREVRLAIAAHRPLKRLVIAWEAGNLRGTIEVAPDPSGYVLVVGRLGEGEDDVFRAYLDHPYEEYELWPDGVPAGTGEESPGRMSKRRTWVSLSTVAWPTLAAAGGRDWFNAAVDEEKLRHA